MMGKLAEGLGNAIPLIKPITIAISGIMDALKALAPFLVAVAVRMKFFHVLFQVLNRPDHQRNISAFPTFPYDSHIWIYRVKEQ